jgi:hypothetical protein
MACPAIVNSMAAAGSSFFADHSNNVRCFGITILHSPVFVLFDIPDHGLYKS